VNTRPTILVIDDSALIRRTVEIGLGEAHGWDVRTAESGAQGLAIASHEKPDAILLDVEMPDLDGPGTLNRLQADEAAQEIPVLFLTGYSTEEHHRRLTALGAAGVITKPFDPSTLATQITQLLGWTPGT
jgi:CheY-like chemotaxis protein